MRIVDLAEHTQINDVALGQDLELEISIDPPDSPYDIRAIKLIAKSDTGRSSIMLLDNRGCPTGLTVFPKLKKRTTNTTRMLFGRFHAFKFAGSSYVNFEVIIQFCLHECPDVSCGNNSQFSRQKRSMYSEKIDDSSPIDPFDREPDVTVLAGIPTNRMSSDNKLYSYEVLDDTDEETVQGNVSKINQIRVESNEVISQRILGNIAQEIIDADVAEMSRKNFTGNTRVLKQLVEVPLQFKLNVRVPDVAESDSLIYGENNQILVAGFGKFFFL